ncbi:NLRC3, partial [Symbiodinium necroappetens]
DKKRKELEEAQELRLNLQGFGLGLREATQAQAQGPTRRAAPPHRGDEEFFKLFAPLCRALPELPKLPVLSLWLGEHGSRFGSGLGGPFRSARSGEEETLSSLPLAGDDEARDLAAGLGQQTELERLTLELWQNSLGRGPQLRAPRSAFWISSLLAAASHLGVGPAGVSESWIHAAAFLRFPPPISFPFAVPRDEGAKAVASALARLTELKELGLYLAWNKIGSGDRSLGSLFSVKPIPMPKFEETGDAGATAVVESLRELPQLTEVGVYLEKNDLGNEEQKKLRATFDALPVRLSLGALVVAFVPSASDLAPKKAEVAPWWYAKRISPWAALGFILGLGTFALPQAIFA